MKIHSRKFDYDLIVVGAGSGGVRAGRIAANHGAKVAIVEGDRPGGTCVIRGCVPKKLLVYGSNFSDEFEDAKGFGWNIGPISHNWKTLIEAKDAELDRLEKVYRDLLKGSGVSLIEGWAKLTAPNEVEVNRKKYSAERILIAVGGTPQIPDVPGLVENSITSNEALSLSRLPEEIVIYGGGYIAMEFASIFNGFGVTTHLVYRGEYPLRGFDEDIRKQVARSVERRGVVLYPNATITSAKKLQSGKMVELDDGRKIYADEMMVATGRRPNTQKLGLRDIGVKMGAVGEILVDGKSGTNLPSVFAIGDVTDRISLTPVAIAEGHAFSDTLFGNQSWNANHTNVPSAVFSQPPIACVGLTEIEAKQKFGRIRVFLSQFRAMKNTLAGREEETLIKIVVDASSDHVVGVHMVGPDSSEIMQGFAVAVKIGVTKADLDSTIGIHPTAAEELVTMKNERQT